MAGTAPRIVRLEATLTCPACGCPSRERMPTDACLWYWDCPGCGARLRPRPGDCCVFCSYADTACPPVQIGDGCCSSAAPG